MSVDVEKVIREYIESVIHMSLATCKDNQPWVCEVHYAVDDNLNIYWRSTSARRHSQEIAVNPRVAGSIVREHQKGEYPLGVYFEGAAELLTDAAAKDNAFEVMKKRYEFDQDIRDQADDPEGHLFYKITVETWYAFGKLEGDKGQKYPLAWHGGKK